MRSVSAESPDHSHARSLEVSKRFRGMSEGVAGLLRVDSCPSRCRQTPSFGDEQRPRLFDKLHVPITHLKDSSQLTAYPSSYQGETKMRLCFALPIVTSATTI